MESSIAYLAENPSIGNYSQPQLMKMCITALAILMLVKTKFLFLPARELRAFSCPNFARLQDCKVANLQTFSSFFNYSNIRNGNLMQFVS